jgi:AcrR family transcriptional regulator
MLETITPMKTAVATDLEPARKGDADKRSRKAAKEVRQVQLIEATIDSLAKRDYSETTMADVADGAGLSRGIVNFHFESKEKAPELKQRMVAEFEKIKAGY